MIGAIFVQLLSWIWVFYFAAIVAIMVGISGVPLIPPDRELTPPRPDRKKGFAALKELDLIGVTLLTTALVLLIYALVEGSNGKWNKGNVIGPLVVSIILLAAFLFYETLLPEEAASV